jgi:hypothetical protein
MPIITTAKTINEVKRQFPYLAKPPVTVDGQPTGVMPRKVAALEFQPIGTLKTALVFPRNIFARVLSVSWQIVAVRFA